MLSRSFFPFARMERKRDALDRLDLNFRWGNFGIRVLKCQLSTFPPGHLIPFHHHSEMEIHYIAKGKGTVTFEDRTFELREGLFYVTGPGVVHQQWSDDQDPMYELCLHCEIVPIEAESNPDEWGVSIEVREAEECMMLLHKCSYAPVVDRFDAMECFLEAYRIWEDQTVGFYTSLKQSIIRILLRTVRVFAPHENVAGIPERNMSVHRYRLAKQYMENNASRPVTLEEVAEAVGLSARQLQRIFRSEGRTTFRDCLEQTRLERICSDLLSGDLPVEEIALRNGYANPNYVYPVFKSKFGMTPTEYRRQRAEHTIVQTKESG